MNETTVTGLISIVVAVAAIIIGVRSMGGVTLPPKRDEPQETEPGYLIEYICDDDWLGYSKGYRMTVGAQAMSKAIKTRDYRYVGHSYDVETGRVYTDERLNT